MTSSVEDQPTHGQILSAVNDLKTKMEIGCENMKKIEEELKRSADTQRTLSLDITNLKVNIALTRGGVIAAAFIIPLITTIVGIVVAGMSARSEQPPPAHTSRIQRSL